MNLTLHLIRKDLRQFRFAALFWAALIAGQVFCANLLLSANAADLDWYNITSIFVNLLYFIGMVVAYLLAGIIVSADAPAGSTVQWRTRPISGGRLLLAKAAVILLFFGVVPVGIWLPWWIHNGFGAQGLAVAITSVFALNLIPALLGSALAAVVDQIGRFMLLTMVLLAALTVFALTSLVPRTIAPTLFSSRLLLDLAVGLAAALLAIAVQYRTRQTAKSATVLVAGVVVILMVRAWWPVDLFVWWKEAHPVPTGTTAVSGQVWNARVGSRLNKEGIEEPFILVNLDIAGLSEGLFFSAGVADVELSWPDGTVVRREKVPVWEGGGYSRSLAELHALGISPANARAEHWDLETAAKYRAMKADFDQRWAGRHNGMPRRRAEELPDSSNASARIELSVSPAIAAKARAQPPTCRIVATLLAKKPVILGEARAQIGASIVDDGRMTVAKLERRRWEPKQPDQLDVRYTGLLTSVRPVFSEQRTYFLVDRVHSSSSWLNYYTIMSVAPVAGWISAHQFDMEPPKLWRTDRWIEMPDWQQRYTVVAEEHQPAGSFQCNVTTDNVKVLSLTEE